MKKYLLIFFVGLIIGYNIGIKCVSLTNLWQIDRTVDGGLTKLDAQMANDKTRRLAAIFFTEQAIYKISSMRGEFIPLGAILHKEKGVSEIIYGDAELTTK